VSSPACVPFCLSVNGIASGSQWSREATVFNADMQAGVYYWVTPNWKVAASYRLDVFSSPLRAFPAASESTAAAIDRYYHGPKFTVTGRI
jgi:hypothetical protein